jgi:hypothetical protein
MVIFLYRFLTLPTLYLILQRIQGLRCWVPGSRFWVQGSGFWVQGSRFSAAAGLKSGQFNRKRNFEKANPPEADKYRISNPPSADCKQGIMNPPADKCRSKVFNQFILIRNSLSAAIPHFIISASGGFDILRFAVPTMCSFIQAPSLSASVQSNRERNYH